MRCRTSGSSANFTISWISFLPPSSAGCDLPAMISCTGRSGSSSSRLRRAGSRSISVSRLYDGTRRAKPMVSTSGSSALSIQPSSAGAAPRFCQERAQPGPGVLDEALAQHPLGRPDVGGRDLVDDVPHLRVVGLDVGAGLRGQVEDLAGHPGRRVHAVGDRADRHVGLVEVGPEPVEHPARHVAVQLGDAVGALGQAEAHHRHVEDRGVAAVEVLGAEGQDLLGRHAGGRAVAREVLLDEVAREPVDAGRDRGVRGEHGAGAGDLERGVEVELRAVGVDGELADPLEAEEARVALVGVEDLGLGGAGDPGVGTEGADAADAEQQLLEQPVLGGAAVQPVGHVAELAGVLLDVGVEQQQRDAADLGDPDAGVQGVARRAPGS